MFKLRGKRPSNLGVKNGRFTAPATPKPNWVSSQVEAGDSHYIAPLAIKGDAKAAMQKLKAVVQKMERVELMESRDDYLYAEFSTRLMGFVDDVEFCCDGKAIHARSSSRLGHSDLGVNRKRIEAVRAALGG